MELSESELNEILNIFKTEGLEILEIMDNKLLMLERDLENKELVLELFRDAHSIKGSARMLGYNSIQNLVHKVEDIFGFFRDYKIKPNSDNLDVIAKTLNYVKFLIEKTVENKAEFFDESYEYYLKSLVDVIDSKEEFKTVEVIEDTTTQTYEENPYVKVESHLYELILNYTLIKKHSNLEYLKAIENATLALEAVSGDIDIENFAVKVEEIKKVIFEIKEKNFSSTNDANELLIELDTKISETISLYTDHCLNNKIQSMDFYEKVFTEIENQVKTKKHTTSKVSDEIKYLVENISNLQENPALIDAVEASLKKIIIALSAHKDNNFFRSILTTFELYKNSGRVVERDTRKGVCDLLVEYLETPSQKRAEDLELFIQRAEIIHNIAHINIKSVQNNVAESKRQSDKSKDWFINVDTSAIKTLRVDSSKLDMLVNGIGELIVNRIKNSEQVLLAKKIQSDFMDWQKGWSKFGHFMKYFDRKYLSTSMSREDAYQGAISYNKQLISLYANQTNKLHKIFAQLDKLYQTMQEQEVGLGTITNELESMVKNMRILPLATIFHLFPRMVHNLAKDKGKNIEFKIHGSEVSADKKIIEDIKIPIMHILRNSIDHGIESPDERKALGKSETGLIQVLAEHREDKIIITIKDDGRGLDVQKIKEKAIEKGILTSLEAEKLPQEQLVNLVYYPGFSTESTITDLSGRGLGLDIVHTKISQLNGRIDITSEYQVGTVVTIELPATMATIKSFVALEADELFAFSASSIKTVVRVYTEEVFTKDDKSYFVFADRVIPVYTLSQILGYDNAPRREEKHTLLIIESDNSQIGIIVEKLIGEEEILFKKLPEPFHKIKNISGITTLANGSSCLILNMTDIMSKSEKRSNTGIIVENVQTIFDEHRKYEILVVDDSRTTKLLEKNILEAQGYKVRIATNAIDALEIMKRTHFNLIVTDNDMPNMTGYEYVQEIRKDVNYKNTPILVLSSNDKNTWWPKFQQVGASAYIQKSEFNQEYCVRTINELLKWI